MDFATLIGLIVGTSIVILAILTDSDIFIFLNIPGALIVLGGTFAATLVKFPIKDCFSSIGFAVRQAFWEETDSSSALIKQIHQFSNIVRKKDVLALEDEEISNPFLKQGIQLCIDGMKPEFVRDLLTNELNMSIERHEKGEHIFRAMGDSAPAFGMIGTLVGLVQMLANLQDTSAIGPAMSVALLTTLYGALFANLVALPIADKLRIRSQNERINKSLIIEGVLGIQQGVHPRIISEMLQTFVPHAYRGEIGNLDNSKNNENDDVDEAMNRR